MKNGIGRKPVVLIAGPTASGKSAVALELAQANDGVIINADALQVYRELRILSARPTAQEERLVPHRLYGMVPATQAYSVGLWLDSARKALADAWASERLPIVTGGTGLYFKALEEGLVRLPAIPAAIRQRWRERLKRGGSAALHAELARGAEEEAGRIRPSDGQRIVRALEVIEATGKPLSAWQKEAQEESFLAQCRVLRLYLSPAREELYTKINERFEQMIEAGAVEEVEGLLALGLDPSLPAMKAAGVQEIGCAIAGKLTLEEACRIAKRNTRHYAKRQLTWGRRHMMSWEWLSEKLMVRSMELFFNFIRLHD
ncbi:MAG TPA: tRNA (adenosine(37)-N6)-dimethylallyltransferase MiaA [Aestuariivirgaceae bacterium]|nr:tRNA (adenosine(37)-N6)-dimethylallyltransferase MiaA [Aestuariivirgaceae bacterium]